MAASKICKQIVASRGGIIFVFFSYKVFVNIIYNLFYQLWLKLGNICQKRERSGKIMSALVISADISLFRQIFPNFNHKLLK